MVPSPYPLINIDNSKKLAKSSKLCNSNKISHTTKYFVKCSFFLNKFFSWKFFILPKVFYTY